ncbi:flagellar filament capping protein FliD [Phytopseudomonas seleniipraecipitans]|uniref:Flagellar hook-associated protein 2 n=1 Tax=Phytopseudomonas seleniipraecipitans TaxID=640205 RepID=A0A1G7NDM1_9GAMM|nr:flagellar filament capping protein FliD [Pseudomonas seleniipraecipitans]SDF71429.1 flagellar hook-associated protein 2 [Pseudomonas seleniipraecipitans]
MAGITGIGGSGLDIDKTVKALVAAERSPKQTQLDNLEKKSTTTITSLGAVKSAMSEFQSALSLINSPSLFQARTATSSKTDLLTATAGLKAGAGSYQIEVKSLATSSKVALASVADSANATFGNGTFTVKVGNTSLPAITIDSTNNTLTGVRDAINKAGADKGLSATIINDSSGARLVLSSTTTGAGEDISVIAGSDDGSGSVNLSKLNFSAPASGEPDPAVGPDDSAARIISRAESAELTVDGLKVISKSNTVDTAIEGLTLNLKGVTAADSPLTVGVSQDKGGVKTNIQNFVDAYNKLMGVISAETKVTPVGDGKAPVIAGLVGDAMARGILSAVRGELVNVPNGSSGVRSLADLGITTQKDGTLTVDSAKLDKQLTNNFESISALFTGDTGLASRLSKRLDPYVQTGGVIEQRDKSLRSTLTTIDKQKEALNTRMQAVEARLFKQFNAMDMMYAQLSNTASSLSASLDNMPWASGNSKK